MYPSENQTAAARPETIQLPFARIAACSMWIICKCWPMLENANACTISAAQSNIYIKQILSTYSMNIAYKEPQWYTAASPHYHFIIFFFCLLHSSCSMEIANFRHETDSFITFYIFRFVCFFLSFFIIFFHIWFDIANVGNLRCARQSVVAGWPTAAGRLCRRASASIAINVKIIRAT